MGGFFSSEPVTPLLQNTNSSNRVSVASSIVRYKPPQHAFDIFERPPSSLDTVYEHDKEREEVPDHPVEQQMDMVDTLSVPNGIQDPKETKEKIYYSNVLEQIQNISAKEFYDLRRVDVQPVIVTDDIVLKRHRPSRQKSKPSTSS
jgi:hypothetical protein